MSLTPPGRPSPWKFPTTHWSRVLAAGKPDALRGREALVALCAAYWFPLYAYIRRRGHDPQQAEDLAQDFFTYVLEEGLFAKADPGRGRFRSFLQVVCDRFLANRRDWEKARKRGGGRLSFPIDTADAEDRYVRECVHELTPERTFERCWALNLIGRVFDQLRQEYDDANRSSVFEALSVVLTEGLREVPYAPIAERLGTSAGAVRVAVHRLRRRYGLLLREEIAATVDDPAEVEDEIRDLFTALRA